MTDEWRHVRAISYGNFLLCDYNDAVGAPDPHGRQSALRDGFKGIFCKKEEGKGEKSIKVEQIRRTWWDAHPWAKHASVADLAWFSIPKKHQKYKKKNKNLFPYTQP